MDDGADYMPGDLPAVESLSLKGHAFGPFELDPFQASAYYATRNSRLTLVEGPACSGKSHLLLHLAGNALSNGRRCLVVAPTMGHLRELQEQLSKLGIGHLCFLATDPERGPLLLQELLRAAGAAPQVAGRGEEERFQQSLARWEREKQKLDERYQALRKPVFGSYNWAETVGLFLASNRQEGKELLSGQLSGQDFRFRFEEYQELRRVVTEIQPLYRPLNTLRHPLQVLHPSIFLERGPAEARAFVAGQLDLFQQRYFRLHKRYLARINEYTDQLTRHYEDWHDRFHQTAQLLRDKIAEGVERYGRDFELTSMTSLRLYGTLVPRVRAILDAKQEIFTRYQELAGAFAREPYIDFRFPPTGEGRHLPRLRSTLTAFAEALSAWRDQLPGQIQEEVTGLSNKSIHPQIDYQGLVLELEEAMDLQISELNDTRLFEEKLENRMLTIPKRRRYLEEILELLENTRLSLRDFEIYYDWRRYWLQISEPARKLVRALIKAKPGSWVAAFESWYLHQCLSKAYEPALPSKELSRRQYVFNSDQLRSQWAAQVSSLWGERRQAAMREWRRRDRKQYQELFIRRKGPTPTSQELWENFRSAWKQVTDVLPLWLMTAETATQLALPDDSFEISLVEEAQALSLSQTATALQTASQNVLFANPALAPLGPPDSLAGQARRAGVPSYNLPFGYGLAPGDILPGRRHSALEPAQPAEQPLTRVESTGGTYDEYREVNEEEARITARRLSEIQMSALRSLPRVSVVAMTPAQRDLIAECVRELKRPEGEEADLIRQLERNGLGFYTPEELSGHRPDILVISCTFSSLGAAGENHRGPLSGAGGRALISILMSRARKGVFAIHSLTDATLAESAGNPAREGVFLLANYLSFLEAMQEGDIGRQEEARERLKALTGNTPAPQRPSAFLGEVALALESILDPPDIHSGVAEVADELPLWVDVPREGARPIALIPDGFFSREKSTDYQWELRQWERLSEEGYDLLPLWSVNWWKNAQTEIRRLAEAIENGGSGEE